MSLSVFGILVSLVQMLGINGSVIIRMRFPIGVENVRRSSLSRSDPAAGEYILTFPPSGGGKEFSPGKRIQEKMCTQKEEKGKKGGKKKKGKKKRKKGEKKRKKRKKEKREGGKEKREEKRK